MARKPTAHTGPAKDAVRSKTGEIDEGGELVRDDIKIVKDEPEKITVVHAEADEPERKPAKEPGLSPDLEKRLEAMERDLAAERRAKADAEARAQAAEQRAQQETGRASNNEDAAFRNHKTAIENAASAATGALQAAKRAFVQAQEAGDFTAAADAQEAIADAKGRLLGLEGEQARIKAWEERPKQEPQPETRRTGAVPATPREAVDVRAMPRKARDYLEDHPEFLDDWKLWNKLTRAHQDAIDDEVDPYSEEYFERYINPRMGTGDNEPPRRRADRGDGAMPPSRSGPSQGTRNSSEVRLTARQVEAAHFSFPELAHEEAEVEYARNLRKLETEERLGTKH